MAPASLADIKWRMLNLATNLILHPSGFWVTPNDQILSYPPDGNDRCFEVEDSSFWFQHRNAVVTDVLKRFPPGDTIFDVGGGNGCVAAAMEKAGYETVMIEPGPQGAANAVKRGLSRVICATVDAAGFKPQSMAAVTMFDVLEHIEDDKGFLEAIHPKLKVGGRLYLTVPAYQTLWSVDDVEAGHFRRYVRSNLRKVVEASGFDVEYLTYFFWLLPVPLLMLRTIPTKLGLRKTVKQDAIVREHQGTGMPGRILRTMLNWERGRISKGKLIPWGASCLLVARKKELTDGNLNQ